MPIYEYECNRCHHRFELKQGFDDEVVSSCPECQGPVRRVILPVGIVFKGSGFYVTDNRRKDQTERAEPEGKLGPGETAKVEEKGVGKTEARDKAAEGSV